MIPHENSMINYGKPKRVLGLLDREKVVELSQIMNDKFTELAKREVSKIKQKNEDLIKDTMKDVGDTSWAVPSHIIVFLQRALENLATTDRRILQLHPWPEFAKLIHDILDHRVE